MDPRDLRDAWVAKYAREPAPWRGPALLEPGVRDALASLPAGSRVLEVGAAGGKTLAALRALALAPVALDWAGRALDVRADATRLPFRDGALPGVALFHVLQHAPLALRERLVAEAARVARPGGVVVGQTFHADDRRAATGAPAGEPGSRLRGGLLHHAFEEGELASLLEGALRDVRVLRHARAERHLGRDATRVLLSFTARA